jgi:hypothetical protein
MNTLHYVSMLHEFDPFLWARKEVRAVRVCSNVSIN